MVKVTHFDKAAHANNGKRQRDQPGRKIDDLPNAAALARRPSPDDGLRAGMPASDTTPTEQNKVLALMRELEQVKSQLESANKRVLELETVADEDPLVPLLNRRGFVRELSRAIAYSRRYKTELSLIYLDLNLFKIINDDFGHAAGDDALRHVAGILTDNVRESDIVGRLGGDEFAIVLVKAGLGAAEVKAAQLEDAVSAAPIVLGAEAVSLGITAGAAAVLHEDNAEQALQRADEAMFARKFSDR